MIHAKVWGKTQKVFELPNVCEFHRIYAIKGGFSSIHTHETKYNAFFCESGLIQITTWEGKLKQDTIIKAGEITTVRPNVKHMFTALENTVCYEIYYAKFESDDIVRDNIGGAK